MNHLLQVISCGPADSKTIQQAGAHRIQLVSALQIGGVTPSYATIRRSLQAVSIPHHVIIRPHNNGFIFNQQQKQLMIEDIIKVKQLNAQGVVIGGLKQQILNQKTIKIVDQDFIKDIINQVGGKMNIVFHKASDRLHNYTQQIKKLLDKGVSTILTQGGELPLLENIPKLKQIQQSAWKHILLGGGITDDNKKQIIDKLQPFQMHIGTCVRQNRYGPVSLEKLCKFMQI